MQLNTQPERECAFIFSLKDIEAFRREFVFDTAFAREQRTRVEQVRLVLGRAGIQPVAMISVRGVPAGIYRLKDLSQ